MISGRGLGATGGTLDKLEAIPGFRTNLSTAEMQTVCRRVGCVISGATADLVPADRKLYALRDVTGTVPSIPLITASIMSKKLAEGLDALVLDVKHGSGAFMKTLDEARALARSMVDTGKRMGVPTTALVTDMNQPLGRMAGNAVEVNESVDALRGKGPADLMEVTLELGAELLVLAKRETTFARRSRQRLQQAIASGAGLEKFREMVAAQGGDLDAPRPVAPAHEVPQPAGRLRRGHRHRTARPRDHRAGRRPQAARRQARSLGRPRNAGPPRRRGRSGPAAGSRFRQARRGGESPALSLLARSRSATIASTHRPLIVERIPESAATLSRRQLDRAYVNHAMTSSDRDELIRAALDAQQRAFCPYSNFPVGAALRTAERHDLSGRQRRERLVRPDDLRRARGRVGGGRRGRARVHRDCRRQPRRRVALRRLPAVPGRVQSEPADHHGRLAAARTQFAKQRSTYSCPADSKAQCSHHAPRDEFVDL